MLVVKAWCSKSSVVVVGNREEGSLDLDVVVEQVKLGSDRSGEVEGTSERLLVGYLQDLLDVARNDRCVIFLVHQRTVFYSFRLRCLETLTSSFSFVDVCLCDRG